MFYSFSERGGWARRGRERKRETQNPKQPPRPGAWRGARTHEPWDHDLSCSQTFDWLSHPGTPVLFFLINIIHTHYKNVKQYMSIKKKKKLPEIPWHEVTTILLGFFFFLSLFILRERTQWGRCRGRERERQWIPGRLHTPRAEPDAGLKLTDSEIMTWTEVRRLTDWVTQAPCNLSFL